MKTQPSALLTLLGLGLFAATAGCGISVITQEVREEFHQSYPLTATGQVRLENVNGNVRIATWERNEIKVDALKRGTSKEHLDAAKIDIETQADQIRIKTKYPRGKAGWLGWRNRNSTSVDYVLTVPSQAQLDKISNVNGGVDLEGVQGDVDASTVNGPLVARRLSGAVKLTTVNGRVRADFAESKRIKSIALDTVNGGVTLTLPSGVNADVAADTVNGGISTDLPLTIKKHFPVGRELSGQLGQGGNEIRLSTVNGGIKINGSQALLLEK
jgi:DUF4097 and DUF4098 domain-containing protein YvlB